MANGKTKQYRNLVPKAMKKQVQAIRAAEWNMEQNSTHGKRHPMVERAYAMRPASKGSMSILDRLLGKVTS